MVDELLLRGGTSRRAAARPAPRSGRRRSRRRTRRRARCGTGPRSGAGRSSRPVSACVCPPAAASASTCGPSRRLDRVVAEERGEERRHGRQVRDPRRVGGRDAVGDEAVVERRGQAGGEPDDHQREEDADREHGWPSSMNVASMPAPAPRWDGGRLFITPALFGEVKRPMPIPFSSRISANQTYEKLDRQHDQEREAERRDQHPARSRTAARRSGRRGSPTPALRRAARRSAAACRCRPRAASARTRSRARAARSPAAR